MSIFLCFHIATVPFTDWHSRQYFFYLHGHHARWVPLSPQLGTSLGCRRRDGLQQLRVAANILNKQLHTNDKEWSSSLVVVRGANNPSL
jgi:hypothetical protein